MGRPSLWDAQHKKLGDTGFTAAIGANIYQDEDNKEPDSYSIDVEFEQKGGVWSVSAGTLRFLVCLMTS